jgi:serine protease Do
MNTNDTPFSLQQLSDALAEIVALAAAASVTVSARQRLPATGVVLGGGVIVTADHVIERDEEITITLPDGTTAPATLAGRDPGTDLAALRTTATLPAPLPEGPLPRVGNLVLAIGRATGIGASLGLVNAVGGPLQTRRGGRIDEIIRADVTLYPGFSGGPLVDASGRLVGINTSGAWGNMGVTLPIGVVKRVVGTLVEHGKMRQGFLGIATQPVALNEALAAQLDGQRSGLLIVGVESGGPAERAGLMVGDILVRFAGEQVARTGDLQWLLAGAAPGTEASLTILRGGQRRDLVATLGERP